MKMEKDRKIWCFFYHFCIRKHFLVGPNWRDPDWSMETSNDLVLIPTCNMSLFSHLSVYTLLFFKAFIFISVPFYSSCPSSCWTHAMSKHPLISGTERLRFCDKLSRGSGAPSNDCLTTGRESSETFWEREKMVELPLKSLWRDSQWCDVYGSRRQKNQKETKHREKHTARSEKGFPVTKPQVSYIYKKHDCLLWFNYNHNVLTHK